MKKHKAVVAPAARLKTAKSFIDTKKYDRALPILSELVHPSVSQVERAQAHYWIATLGAQEHIQLTPDDVESHYTQSMALGHRGDERPIRQYLQDVKVKKEAATIDRLDDEGYQHVQREEYPQAIKSYTDLLKFVQSESFESLRSRFPMIEETEANALCNLGLCYENLHRYSVAKAHYNQSLDKLVRVRRKKAKDPLESKEDVEPYACPTHLRLANFLIAQSKQTEAYGCLKALLEDPYVSQQDKAEAHTLIIGLCTDGLISLSSAEVDSHYEKAAALGKEEMPLIRELNLAKQAFKKKNMEQAIAHAMKAKEIKNPVYKIDALFFLGMVYTKAVSYKQLPPFMAGDKTPSILAAEFYGECISAYKRALKDQKGLGLRGAHFTIAAAAHNLGKLFDGVDPTFPHTNQRKAHEYFKYAADTFDYHLSVYELGLRYFKEQDIPNALHYFRKGERQNHAASRYMLACVLAGYPKHQLPTENVEELYLSVSRQAKSKNLRGKALNALGVFYLDVKTPRMDDAPVQIRLESKEDQQKKFPRRDFVKAMRCFEEAAALGNLVARANLSSLDFPDMPTNYHHEFKRLENEWRVLERLISESNENLDRSAEYYWECMVAVFRQHASLSILIRGKSYHYTQRMIENIKRMQGFTCRLQRRLEVYTELLEGYRHTLYATHVALLSISENISDVFVFVKIARQFSATPQEDEVKLTELKRERFFLFHANVKANQRLLRMADSTSDPESVLKNMIGTITATSDAVQYATFIHRVGRLFEEHADNKALRQNQLSDVLPILRVAQVKLFQQGCSSRILVNILEGLSKLSLKGNVSIYAACVCVGYAHAVTMMEELGLRDLIVIIYASIRLDYSSVAFERIFTTMLPRLIEKTFNQFEQGNEQDLSNLVFALAILDNLGIDYKYLKWFQDFIQHVQKSSFESEESVSQVYFALSYFAKYMALTIDTRVVSHLEERTLSYSKRTRTSRSQHRVVDCLKPFFAHTEEEAMVGVLPVDAILTRRFGTSVVFQYDGYAHTLLGEEKDDAPIPTAQTKFRDRYIANICHEKLICVKAHVLDKPSEKPNAQRVKEYCEELLGETLIRQNANRETVGLVSHSHGMPAVARSAFLSARRSAAADEWTVVSNKKANKSNPGYR